MEGVVPITAWTQKPTTEAPIVRKKSKYPYERVYVGNDGRKWYFLLVEREVYDADGNTKKDPSPRGLIPLMAEVPLAELSGKLVIGLQKDERLFTTFDSHIDFAYFLRNIKEDQRCFYEIIMGEFPQKPHFDIEVSRQDHPEYFATVEPDQLCELILDCILTVFKNKDIELSLERDILIFSSHGENKISFHIVIDNYCHCNNAEAKQLYKKVYALLPAQLQEMKPPILDHAVYSKKQQFRIVGCQKYKSGRIKRLRKEWTFHGKTIVHQYIEEPESLYHEYLLQLESSLVSNTSTCFLLPSFFEESDARPDNIEYKDITQEQADHAIKLLAELMGVTPDDPRFPYRLLDLKGGIIVLKRLRPSNCRICSRVHEAENPFLFVIDGAVYFHCRRAPANKKFFVGRIAPAQSGPNPLPVSEVEVRKEAAVNWCTDVVNRIKQLASEPTRPVTMSITLKDVELRRREEEVILPELLERHQKEQEQLLRGVQQEAIQRQLEELARNEKKRLEELKGQSVRAPKVSLQRK